MAEQELSYPFGDVSPALAEITDRVLFGEVWERPGLSARDRSLATVAALVTGGNVEQLAFHLPYAVGNGVTRDELIEMINHLAFYAGWPRAVSALNVVREALPEE